MRKAIIHIGRHKTGTTSFQLLLSSKSNFFKRKGVAVVPHRLTKRMAAATAREGLPIPPRLTLAKQGISFTKEDVTSTVEEFIEANSKCHTMLISSEHLSYFREQHEIDNLLAMLKGITEIEIYAVLRDIEDFKRSYTAQIIKTKHKLATDKTSPYYIEADSWLYDDEAMLALWRKNFSKVVVLDYNPVDIVERLVKTMGVPMPRVKEEIRANVTKTPA